MLARRAKASGRPAPPFATVVTDLTSCHPTWFHRGVDRCFVPTEEVAQLARRAGLTDPQIVQHGLPIRPAFAAPLPPRPALRQRLGLAPQGSVVLLMGGGEGMGLLEPTALALADALPESAQIVVVCGRNAALAARLEARQWRCRMVVKGFVSDIDEWMGASDVVITKAGPGTIAEALIRGVPLLLNGAIPCQEEGNVPFVVEVRPAVVRFACISPVSRFSRWLPSFNSERGGPVHHRAEGDRGAGGVLVWPHRGRAGGDGGQGQDAGPPQRNLPHRARPGRPVPRQGLKQASVEPMEGKRGCGRRQSAGDASECYSNKSTYKSARA